MLSSYLHHFAIKASCWWFRFFLFNLFIANDEKSMPNLVTRRALIQKSLMGFGALSVTSILVGCNDDNNSENAPNPSREDVKIVNIEGGHYAVLRYSGRASDGNFLKYKEILEKELQKNNISIISPPIRATYDSPFTLPMNRRNEAMFKVELN